MRRIPNQQFRQAKDQLGAVAEQGIPFSRRRDAAEPGCADEVLRSTTAVLQRATAAPWRASASRRRPPLRAGDWGGGQGGFPAAAVALLIRPAGVGLGVSIARDCLARLRGCPSSLALWLAVKMAGWLSLHLGLRA